MEWLAKSCFLNSEVIRTVRTKPRTLIYPPSCPSLLFCAPTHGSVAEVSETAEAEVSSAPADEDSDSLNDPEPFETDGARQHGGQ
jgi:hypothetical protein